MKHLHHAHLNLISGGYDCFCAKPSQLKAVRQAYEHIAPTITEMHQYGAHDLAAEALLVVKSAASHLHIVIPDNHKELKNLTKDQLCTEACNKAAEKLGIAEGLVRI